MRFFGISVLLLFGLMAAFPFIFANEIGSEQNMQKLQYALLPINSTLFRIESKLDSSIIWANDTATLNNQLHLFLPTDTITFSTKESESISTRWFPLGTDALGRCYWSQLVIGCRVSLGIGLIAVLLSTCIGISVGAISGYFGGKVDSTIMYGLQVFWSIPTILLALCISLIIGKGIIAVLLAIGLTIWIDFARVVRNLVLGLKELEYVQAAKMLGLPPYRIIIRHLLPNILRPSAVLIVGSFSSAILLEAGLGFLGLSIPKPNPSWGSMLAEFRNHIFFGKAYLALAPGICISLTVLSFYILGKQLRDSLDVKLE